MRHEYNYEDAFYHYRPEYMVTGRKNITRYTITGTFTNGEYFRYRLNNKRDVQWWLHYINVAVEVQPDSLAMQNEVGQLMWNSETGFNDGIIHPKYMDRMECMKPSFWNHVSGF